MTDPTQLPSLVAYTLQSGSPVIDAGLDLQALFGTDAGPRDFYGVPIPQGGGLDIGASELLVRLSDGGLLEAREFAIYGLLQKTRPGDGGGAR